MVIFVVIFNGNVFHPAPMDPSFLLSFSARIAALGRKVTIAGGDYVISEGAADFSWK
jgi:hypothetical protein